MISPLLGNIYLHYVFDLWAERWRRQEARGDMIVVRYADDLVAGFEHEGDARRFLDAMRERFAYYAIPTNSRALSAFRHYVDDIWRRTLRRRSQKDGFTWDRMTKLANDWLPAPRIRHPWPDQRFAVKHPR